MSQLQNIPETPQVMLNCFLLQNLIPWEMMKQMMGPIPAQIIPISLGNFMSPKDIGPFVSQFTAESQKKNIEQVDSTIKIEENAENIKEPEDKCLFGHWTSEEHQKYLTFIQEHQATFTSRLMKKSKKIFKLMAQFIPSRTAAQCRSHHQKMWPYITRKIKSKRKRRRNPLLVLKPLPKNSNT